VFCGFGSLLWGPKKNGISRKTPREARDSATGGGGQGGGEKGKKKGGPHYQNPGRLAGGGVGTILSVGPQNTLSFSPNRGGTDHLGSNLKSRLAQPGRNSLAIGVEGVFYPRPGGPIRGRGAPREEKKGGVNQAVEFHETKKNPALPLFIFAVFPRGPGERGARTARAKDAGDFRGGLPSGRTRGTFH